MNQKTNTLSPSENEAAVSYQNAKQRRLEEMERLEEGQEKKCFKCGVVKPLRLFYRHPRMSDGHLGKCKLCTKKDVHGRYISPDGNIKVKLYEKFRNGTEHRKSQRISYQKIRRRKSPGKARAHYLVCNAVRDGKLRRMPCEVCGNPKSEAHHDDYRKPLDVKWLCFIHHRQRHGQLLT